MQRQFKTKFWGSSFTCPLLWEVLNLTEPGWKHSKFIEDLILLCKSLESYSNPSFMQPSPNPFFTWTSPLQRGIAAWDQGFKAQIVMVQLSNFGLDWWGICKLWDVVAERTLESSKVRTVQLLKKSHQTYFHSPCSCECYWHYPGRNKTFPEVVAK